MRKHLKYVYLTEWSIYYKLVGSLLMVIVPILLVGLYINQFSEAKVRSEIGQSIASKVHFYIESLQSEIENLNRLKTEFINDDDLQTLSVVPETYNVFEKQKAILNVISKLNFFETSSPYIENIKIFIPKLGRSIIANSLEDTISDEELRVINEAAQSGARLTVWNNHLLLSEIYPPMLQASDPQLFVMELLLSNSAIKQTLASITNSDKGGALLYQPTTRWLVSDGKNPKLQQSLKEYLKNESLVDNTIKPTRVKINGNQYIVSMEHSPLLDLALVVYEPEDWILGPLEAYKKWFWLLSLLSAFLISLFAYWNFRQIHTPLKRLVIAFRKVENGDFTINIQHLYNDEFNYLYKQFNLMVGQINILISEVYEQKILSQKSELKQLQSQINPHFLYNSYYVLYRLAEREETEKVKDYTKHLGDYFRFITRSGSDEITLEEEMAHAKAYINIQSVRFSSRIDVLIEEIPQDGDSRHIILPRLILQPILENAYHHGLEHKMHGGKLTISFSITQGIFTIFIQDNGDDLNEESLLQLQQQLQSEKTFETTGMVNVHRRLQLKFGKAHGLTLSRGSMGGLCIQISIPVGMERAG
ncbi:sensor histidine kinase [Paenibacillus roseipurpureus]|uniref:Histidine kinase n=1 Tax=Paenibacillus roseopurpureus TaxID=2918901 RepID=A0AA96RM26_9BACL|nr:histidine kinase [Paenibacillus sp. MBLB1832]WNR46026.1 histidine kinase [Paenibacillus sp. MBLB1832]